MSPRHRRKSQSRAGRRGSRRAYGSSPERSMSPRRKRSKSRSRRDAERHERRNHSMDPRMFRSRSRGAPLRRSVRRYADDVQSVRLASPKGHSPASHSRAKRGRSAAPRLRRDSRDEEVLLRRMSRDEMRGRERARSKLREQRALAALKRARSRERRKTKVEVVSSSDEEDSSDESDSSSEEEKPGLMSSMVSAVQSFLSKGESSDSDSDDSDDSDSDSESSISEASKVEMRNRVLEAKRREQQMRANARSAYNSRKMNKLYGESRRERELRTRAIARARAAREEKARQYQILDRVAHEKEELARSRAQLKGKLEKERMKALKNQMR